VRSFSQDNMKLLVGYCDKIHFFLLFPLYFLYIFNTITTMGGKLPTKRHYCSIPGHCSLLGLPSHYGLWLTQHYQDYDVNYDNSSCLPTSHSIHFLIQCSLLWLALLAFFELLYTVLTLWLSLSELLHCVGCLLYSLVITQQVMCALYSTMALASLFITCGSLHSLVILSRHFSTVLITLALP